MRVAREPVLLLAGLGLGVLDTAAWAHDVTLWPEQTGKSVTLGMRYGDPGDYQPIDKIRVVELAVFDSRSVRISFLRDRHRLELIPRGDPFAAKDGSVLPVEVRFDGVVRPFIQVPDR